MLHPSGLQSLFEVLLCDTRQPLVACKLHSRYGLLLPCLLQARDINLDIKRVVAYRYWCNKLWNAIKFAMMNLPAGFQPLPQQQLAQQMQSWPAAARWVLSRLNSAVETINKVGRMQLLLFGNVVDCWHTNMFETW
jgi:valyl-tRNA synthetase